MKIFYCKFRGCECHRGGPATAIILAFNRGHAVKLLNKRFEEGGAAPVPNDKHHQIEELDPEDPLYKKGHVLLHYA